MSATVHALDRAERALEDGYQHQLERRDETSRRVMYAEAALRAELQEAITKNGWVRIVSGPRDTLERVHVANLFSDETGADELCALLLNALAHSDCELVKAARECFVRRVVDAHAADIVTFDYDGWGSE